MFSDQFNIEEDEVAAMLQAAQFISKIKAGALTEAEQEYLDSWLNGDPKRKQCLDDLLRETYWNAEMELYERATQGASSAWQDVESRMQTTAQQDTATINPAMPTKIRSLFKWGWAAAIIIMLASGIYLFSDSERSNTISENNQPIADATKVFPASNKAILTLQNGEQVQLDSAANLALTEKGIRKGKELISYEGMDRAAETNILTTPRGVQYQLVLADGTKVWLNAESSITYPSSFNDPIRKVQITGEVYFEVAPNKAKPFYVVLEHQEIQVLGTSFNVNAYQNEAIINTALIDGAIRVNYLSADKMTETTTAPDKTASSGWSVVLAPGQQAQLLKSWSESISTPPIKVNKRFNKENILAWKNGLFDFEGADIYEVMRQLERWYNIKVAYQGKLRSEEFQGKMYRNVSLAVVLEMLEKMGYKWKLDGDVYTIAN